jgi:hypothetical protein
MSRDHADVTLKLSRDGDSRLEESELEELDMSED